MAQRAMRMKEIKHYIGNQRKSYNERACCANTNRENKMYAKANANCVNNKNQCTNIRLKWRTTAAKACLRLVSAASLCRCIYDVYIAVDRSNRMPDTTATTTTTTKCLSFDLNGGNEQQAQHIHSPFKTIDYFIYKRNLSRV